MGQGSSVGTGAEFQPASVPPLWTAATATPGWVVWTKYTSTDATCTTAATGSELGDLAPLDECYHDGREHIKYVCEDDKALLKTKYEWESSDAEPAQEMCHYGENEQLFTKAGVRAVNSHKACSTEGISSDNRCGGKSGDNGSEADSTKTPISTTDAVADINACWKLCTAESTCGKISYNKTSKKCELWKKEDCDMTYEVSGWDSTWGDNGPEDWGAINPCAATGDSLPGGYVVTNREKDGKDATCDMNHDRDYFIFDFCVKAKHSAEYEAVYCKDDKVYHASWPAATGDAAQCSGTPSEVKLITNECSTDGSQKYKGVWWGKCKPPTLASPTAKPTLANTPAPTDPVDKMHGGLKYFGAQTTISDYFPHNYHNGDWPYCEKKSKGIVETVPMKLGHCFKHGTDPDKSETTWIKFFCSKDGQPGYVYTEESKAVCEGLTEDKVTWISNKCEYPICSPKTTAVAGVTISRWKSSTCNKNLENPERTVPLDYCVGYEFGGDQGFPYAFSMKGTDVVMSYWRKAADADATVANPANCKSAPTGTITLKKGVCTELVHGTDKSYWLWDGTKFEGDSAADSGGSVIAAGISGALGMLGILL